MLSFNAWKKEDRDAAVIRTLQGSIVILLLLCILFAVGWMNAPSHLRIYIPPDISNGATLKINEVPNPLIYSFAYEIWQEINYWPEEGAQNYGKNLKAYAAYLTPDFQRSLRQEEAELKAAGQLQRQRFLQGISGAAYNSENVRKLSDNTWEVELDMRLTEFKNNQPVKDIDMRYPLKITRREVSHQDNPYGLALAGFTAAPVREKTNL